MNQPQSKSPSAPTEKVLPFQNTSQAFIADLNPAICKWLPHVTNNDVLCDGYELTDKHAGNIMFRKIVNENQERYFSASKKDKAQVPHEVVSKIRGLNPPGRFLEKVEGESGGYCWKEIGDNKAKEIVILALKDDNKTEMIFKQKFTGASAALFAKGCMSFLENNEDLQDYIPDKLPVWLGLSPPQRCQLVKEVMVALICEEEPLDQIQDEKHFLAYMSICEIILNELEEEIHYELKTHDDPNLKANLKAIQNSGPSKQDMITPFIVQSLRSYLKPDAKNKELYDIFRWRIMCDDAIQEHYDTLKAHDSIYLNLNWKHNDKDMWNKAIPSLFMKSGLINDLPSIESMLCLHSGNMTSKLNEDSCKQKVEEWCNSFDNTYVTRQYFLDQRCIFAVSADDKLCISHLSSNEKRTKRDNRNWCSKFEEALNDIKVEIASLGNYQKRLNVFRSIGKSDLPTASENTKEEDSDTNASKKSVENINGTSKPSEPQSTETDIPETSEEAKEGKYNMKTSTADWNDLARNEIKKQSIVQQPLSNYISHETESTILPSSRFSDTDIEQKMLQFNQKPPHFDSNDTSVPSPPPPSFYQQCFEFLFKERTSDGNMNIESKWYSNLKQSIQTTTLLEKQLQQKFQQCLIKLEDFLASKQQYLKDYEDLQKIKLDVEVALINASRGGGNNIFGSIMHPMNMVGINGSSSAGIGLQQQQFSSGETPSTLNMNVTTDPSGSIDKTNSTSTSNADCGQQKSSDVDLLLALANAAGKDTTNRNHNKDASSRSIIHNSAYNNNINLQNQHMNMQASMQYDTQQNPTKKQKLNQGNVPLYQSNPMVNPDTNIMPPPVPYRPNSFNKHKGKRSLSSSSQQTSNQAKKTSDLNASRIKSNRNLQLPTRELAKLLPVHQQSVTQNQNDGQSLMNQIENQAPNQQSQTTNLKTVSDDVDSSPFTSSLLGEKVAAHRNTPDAFIMGFNNDYKWLPNVTNNDVLCGRGGLTNNHVGNVAFRQHVSENQERYLFASKREKALVAHEIVRKIRGLDPPGRFLKKTNGDNADNCWVEIGDKKAREKTSQALREKAPELMENIHKNYESTRHFRNNFIVNSGGLGNFPPMNNGSNLMFDNSMGMVQSGFNGGYGNGMNNLHMQTSSMRMPNQQPNEQHQTAGQYHLQSQPGSYGVGKNTADI